MAVDSSAQPDKSPEIQAVGDQIFDSPGGKTCHQCRQKIKNISAACKNQRNNKPCTIKLCHKCLLNRYGEIAEEVAVVGEWSCPKCRGICNCSVCMKRRGHQPTGQLSNTAKANGFSSVSEMLVKGAACVNHEKVGAAMADSAKKGGVTSPGKRGKENSFDGQVDENVPSSDEKSSKKVKGARNGITNHGHKRERNKEGFDNIHDCNSNGGVLSGGTGLRFCEKKSKKMKRDRAAEMGNDNDRAAVPHADIAPPVGTELTSVAGIDLRAEDIGNALQFLEFCAVFGKILGLRKGQPELVLQDLFHGRAARRGKYSMTAQFHNHLLSVLQPEHETNSETESLDDEQNSWFETVKKCMSESKSILKAQGLDSLEKAVDYETLNASERLSILNVLCDEILGTEKVRSWIDDQNTKFAEQVKETKQKERSLKQKTKNGIDKTISPASGESHSISEPVETSHDKSEAAKDHANVPESKEMLLRGNRASEAVRIDPVFLDCRGHAYWKLNSLGKPDILHQDIAKGDDTLTLNEKWFGLDAEGKYVIEKHVNFLRQNGRPGGV